MPRAASATPRSSDPKVILPPSPKTSRRKLLDDLRVHQIELQMQNQELVRAKGELERSRARYFELFDLAPVGYVTLAGPRGTVENLNLAAAELLQVDRQAAPRSLFVSFLDAASKRSFRDHLDAVFEGAERQSLDVVLAGARHTPRRHVHVVSRLLRGEMGDHPLCLSAMLDVTARKSAEEESARLNTALQQRTVQLEESNKDLEAFVYSISHDLRAPLRNMAGFATIIAEDFRGNMPPEVEGYARRIIAANEKMMLLVDDLLRFSRLGRKPLEVVPTDLNTLVEEALTGLANEIRGRAIEWRRQMLPIAECDRTLMQQVFVNLLSNALKYSRPRKPAIISIGTDLREGQRCVFVRDNGVGFDMRYRDKLFGVFQRLHVQSEFEGNGVGLAMVARILNRHGGKVYAEGAVDRGATFWFTFEGLRNAI